MSTIGPEKVALAKKKISKRFPKYDLSKFIITDMFRYFPYENGEFDSVVAIQSIYHGFREDMQKSIFEIARVLRSGGVFIFNNAYILIGGLNVYILSKCQIA